MKSPHKSYVNAKWANVRPAVRVPIILTIVTLSALQNWKWPGKIRELENFIERSVILTNGSVLSPPLPMLDPDESVEPEATDTSVTTLESAQRQHILEAVRCSKGRVSGPSGAAARKGLKRTTLQSKMKI